MNYRQITATLIKHSFPLLQNKRIRVMAGWLRFYAFSVWIPPCLRIIVLSKRTRKLGESALTGLLAHELCHQERYLQMGTLRYLDFVVKFVLSRTVRGSEEQATDRLTIEKGYGRQLYDLSMITHEDSRHKKINEFYLSTDEIKTYSESLGKW